MKKVVLGEPKHLPGFELLRALNAIECAVVPVNRSDDIFKMLEVRSDWDAVMVCGWVEPMQGIDIVHRLAADERYKHLRLILYVSDIKEADEEVHGQKKLGNVVYLNEDTMFDGDTLRTALLGP